MEYLLDLGFTNNELENLKQTLNNSIIEMLETFPKIVAINYQYLNNINISNLKEVFTNHTKMFLLNPDRFKAIFDKYDEEDLVRCIEKNAAVVEKL